jgi:hypothetical protein
MTEIKKVFMKKNVEQVTPLDVAKVLGVENQYLNVLVEHELKENHIQNELEKTEEGFFNDGFVELPK